MLSRKLTIVIQLCLQKFQANMFIVIPPLKGPGSGYFKPVVSSFIHSLAVTPHGCCSTSVTTASSDVFTITEIGEQHKSSRSSLFFRCCSQLAENQTRLAVVAHKFDPSPREAEAGLQKNLSRTGEIAQQSRTRGIVAERRSGFCSQHAHGGSQP